ncbi:MAG: hypothetical protein ABIO06_07075 [Pseudolysinimonas sp.]
MAGLVGWGLLLAVVSLPGLIAPRAVWELFSSWQYRDPEAMKPSNRRFRVARLGSATTALVGIVIVMGGLWPGDATAKATAALITALCGVVIVIVLSVISVVARKRRLSSGQESEERPPPNEPSDLAYWNDYFGIGIYVLVMFVVIFAVFGIAQHEKEQAAQYRADHDGVLTPEQQQRVNEVEKTFHRLHTQTVPVSAVVPDSAVITESMAWDPVDLSRRLPQEAWDQSQGDGPEADAKLASSDLVLSFYGFSCIVDGFVVQETDTTVAIAAVVRNGVVAEGTTVASCTGANAVLADYYPIDLAAPLGDRTLVTLDGHPLRKAFHS